MSEVALVAICAASTPLQALLGTPPNQRVYPTQVPQDVQTYPAVAYWRLSHLRPPLMGSDAGMAQALYQLDVFADTATAAAAVRDALRVACNRQRGTFGGVVVDDTFWQSDLMQFDELARLHHVVAELEIHWQEGT